MLHPGPRPAPASPPPFPTAQLRHRRRRHHTTCPRGSSHAPGQTRAASLLFASPRCIPSKPPPTWCCASSGGHWGALEQGPLVARRGKLSLCGFIQLSRLLHTSNSCFGPMFNVFICVLWPAGVRRPLLLVRTFLQAARCSGRGGLVAAAGPTGVLQTQTGNAGRGLNANNHSCMRWQPSWNGCRQDRPSFSCSPVQVIMVGNRGKRHSGSSLL